MLLIENKPIGTIDVYEVEDAAQELWDGYRLVEEQDFLVYKNFFFTWDACREHIKQNQHHYSDKARAYAEHAWRNPEMNAVVKLLKMISKEE